MNAKIQKNVLLAPHTTFKIGGPAKYFVEADSIEEIQDVCCWAKKNNLPVFVLGGGSNVLISDRGFDGLVIKVRNSKFIIRPSRGGASNFQVQAEARMTLAKLVLEAANHGLSGLEWAVGIPGTVGGAIAGNAGAFGQSISDSIEKVGVLDMNELKVRNYEPRGCDFEYRDSIFKQNNNLVILAAVFNFKKGGKSLIKKTIAENLKQRQNSFAGSGPVNWRSAGCFFKNIEWKRPDINKEEFIKNFSELKQFSNKSKIATGFLVDFLGLKGKNIGCAQVSSQHANFILNTGTATAEQIMSLAGLVKNKIYSRYGFVLENEINLIGFD